MNKATAAPQDLRAMLRPIAHAGTLAALAVLGGFAAWSALAPLSSAAIAPGIVSPESSRKTVQHLEGGIVEDLRVREGDRVNAGDGWSACRRSRRAHVSAARNGNGGAWSPSASVSRRW